MKNKIQLGLVLVILIGISFFAGTYMADQKNSDARIARCSTMISFAIDKAENGDLTDQGTMKALISNVYAACQFCDDAKVANQLHDLWNYLIFESDNNDSAKEIILVELNDALRSIKTSM